MKQEQVAALRIANIVIEKAKENSIQKIGKIVINIPPNNTLNMSELEKEYNDLKINFSILDESSLIFKSIKVKGIKIDTIESL